VRVTDRIWPVLLVALGACAARPQPSKVVEAPWGDEVLGVRCRVRAPSVATQGDLVRTSVDVGVSRPVENGIAFDPDLRTRKTSLELVGRDGRRVVRTYDPYLGMPPPPDELPSRLRDPDRPLTETIEFPLAKVWGVLAPGVYRCRVLLAYEPRLQGCFRGTLVSPEFPLRVDPARPSEETYLLPKALRVVETTFDDEAGQRIPVRQVTYGTGDAEEVRLPRRNGFFLGTKLYRDGALFGEGGGMEPAHPIDQSFGTGPSAQQLGASYTIVIFETADEPGHMWTPVSDGYRELWRRTIAVASGADGG